MSDNPYLNTARVGLNTDATPDQVQPGQLTFALNANVESFDGNLVTYQNDQASDECASFPYGFDVIGKKEIPQISRVLFWLTNGTDSQIGYIDNDNCQYVTLISDEGQQDKLNFSREFPIKKAVVKTTNCSTQVYWPDGLNPRRFIDFDDLPWKEIPDPSNDFKRIKLVGELDVNKLLVQPNFSIPKISPESINTGGNLKAGTYQFAIQYANSNGEGYTSYYSVTNPLGIFESVMGQNYDFPTTKSIDLKLENLDTTGLYEYINIAVVKTINNITSVELITTEPIKSTSQTYTYTGTGSYEQLSISDIFEKFNYYDTAGDVYEVDNVIGWADLKSDDEVNYQQIWSKVKLRWETYKVPYDKFRGYNGINTERLRCYMRDEVYAFEGVFLLTNGKQVKACHIPGRAALPSDRELIPVSNRDNRYSTEDACTDPTAKERWQVYNTGWKIGNTPEFQDYVDNNDPEVIEVITNPNTGNTISGTIVLNCNDNNCTQQGGIGMTISFSSPVPTGGITLQFGTITWSGANPSSKIASGWNIFSVPQGVGYDNFHGPSPFTIQIPAGTTTISFPNASIGNGKTSWTCHNCLFPISDLYIKSPCNVANFTVQSNSSVPVTVHNISDTCGEPIIKRYYQYKCYEGPYEYGEFGYWESEELYPNNAEIWGSLRGTKIKHHKFPDLLISPIHDNNPNNDPSFDHSIFPIGVQVDIQSLYDAIAASNLTQNQKDQIVGFKIVRGNRATNKSVIAKGLMHNVGKSNYDGKDYYYPNYPYNDLRADPFYAKGKGEVKNHDGYLPAKRLEGFSSDDSKSRFTFHSPDTHFYQPSISNQGQYLKLETVEYGKSFGHFIKVEDNAEYKFLTRNTIYAAAGLAIASGLTVGAGSYGWPEYSMAPLASTYNAANELFEKLVPYNNFGYSYHSIGMYGNSYAVPNDGFKLRGIDYNTYLIDQIKGVENNKIINNIYRESSIYIRTNDIFGYPHEYNTTEIKRDNSRFSLSSQAEDGGDSSDPFNRVPRDICSYYAAIKRELPRQWGQMYSYETIDTGYYQPLYNGSTRFSRVKAVFGGDIFINRFGYKSKLPIFRSNTVLKNNQSDISYDELGNINYPMFWLSTKPADFSIDIKNELDDLKNELFTPNFLDILGNITSGGAKGSLEAVQFVRRLFDEIYNKVGVKNINLDQQYTEGLAELGKMYLFIYGIPYFFCESEVNVDYRQAIDNKAGNFFPNVSEDIPDDWLQEKNVSIINDNTYFYNQTYSKQNKENFFSHLREDFDPEETCLTEFPNRTIWSDKSSQEEIRNNWLVYKPANYFDFPKSFGKLTSLDRLENNQVLARFENRAQVYNALTVLDVSAGPAASVGRGNMFSTPPIDLADVEIGYGGSQNKALVKTEFGTVYVDAKRGQVLLMQGLKIRDLSDVGRSKWFSKNLPFNILKNIPNIDIDNNFYGIGLHGVYDAFYQRLILTKIDYEAKSNIVCGEDGCFYDDSELGEVRLVEVGDPDFFIDRSWTTSFNFKTNSWISMHSFIPKYYIAHPNYFQSGRLPKSKVTGSIVDPSNANFLNTLWNHNTIYTEFNKYYGEQFPYILEYPVAYKLQDEILQNIKDYTSVVKYENAEIFYEPDETIYFNKAIVYNRQQNSGLLNLVPKPVNDMSIYMTYPKLNTDSKDILVTKSDNFYNFNTFWNIVKDNSEPSFTVSDDFKLADKELNDSNMDYSSRDFKKALFRAKDSRVRLILDNRSDVKLISKFILQNTTPSYK